MAEGALSTVLAESWTHFSPLMRPVLINAVWEQAEPGSFAVHIPEKLYEAAKTYNGAARLTEFVHTFYGLEIQVCLVPDATLQMPNPEQTAEPARGMAERGDRQEQPERRMQTQAGTKKAAPARGGAKKAAIPKDAVLLGTPAGTKLMPMQEVNEESGTVTVQGEILSMDVKLRKDESFIVALYLSDKTGTLPLKLFLRKEEKSIVERIEKCRKDGKWLVAHGRYARDDFMSMHCVFPNWLYLQNPSAGKTRLNTSAWNCTFTRRCPLWMGLLTPKRRLRLPRAGGIRPLQSRITAWYRHSRRWWPQRTSLRKTGRILKPFWAWKGTFCRTAL